MKIVKMKSRGSRQNVVRDRVLKSEGRFWVPGDFDGAASTVLHALAHLVVDGELRRVRKGLYWRGVKTLLGMSPPPTDKLLAAVVGTRGVGPAGLSAANALRLSTQVPRYRHVAVPSRPPTGVPRVTFHDRSARPSRAQARLTPSEVALLEVLDGWQAVIEVTPGQAWAVLGELVRTGQVRPRQLASAAKTEPARVRHRLEELLTRTGQTAALETFGRATRGRTSAHG